MIYFIIFLIAPGWNVPQHSSCFISWASPPGKMEFPKRKKAGHQGRGGILQQQQGKVSLVKGSKDPCRGGTQSTLRRKAPDCVSHKHFLLCHIPAGSQMQGTCHCKDHQPTAKKLHLEKPVQNRNGLCSSHLVFEFCQSVLTPTSCMLSPSSTLYLLACRGQIIMGQHHGLSFHLYSVSGVPDLKRNHSNALTNRGYVCVTQQRCRCVHTFICASNLTLWVLLPCLVMQPNSRVIG